MKEILEKWQRLGQGMSMMNREAHYQALTAVKPTIVSYITKLVAGMGVDEIKSFNIMGNIVMLRKLQPDSYSGTIKAQNGDIIHAFEHHSIPEIAGQVQSLFEMYDDVHEDNSSEEYDKLIGKLKGTVVVDEAEPGLVSQLLNILAPTVDEDKVKAEIKDVAVRAKDLSDEVREKRKSGASSNDVQKLKDDVKAMLSRVEALVASQVPLKAKDDPMLETIHDIKSKHDSLVDRSQQELNILADRVAELHRQLENIKSSTSEDGHKVVHVHINT